MWAKFFNSNISMREVIIISILQGFDQKNHFEGWSLSRFNHFGLALRIALKFYTSVAKRLNLKIRKFWGLIAMFLKDTGEKLEGRPFCPPPPILNRVNEWEQVCEEIKKKKEIFGYLLRI